MKQAFEKIVNRFIDEVTTSLRPMFIVEKLEYLKVKKKDIRTNYKFLVKKGSFALNRDPDGNGLTTTKVNFEVIPFFSINIDPQAEYLVPKWWHKLIFWKKFKYHSFFMRRKFKSIKDLL